MIQFTPGGYDKNVEQIRKEARAATIAEVLVVVRDSEYDVAWIGTDFSDYEKGRRNGYYKACKNIAARLAALSPTPNEP